MSQHASVAAVRQQTTTHRRPDLGRNGGRRAEPGQGLRRARLWRHGLLVAVLVAIASPAWASDADWLPETTKPAEVRAPLTPHWLAVGLGANVRDTTYGALHLEWALDRRMSVGALFTLGWRQDDVRRLQSGVVAETADVRQWTLGLEGAWYVLGDFDRGAKVGLFGLSLAEPKVSTPPANSSPTAIWYPVGDGFALGPYVGGRYTLPLPGDLPFALTGDVAAGVGFAAVSTWKYPKDAGLAQRGDGMEVVDTWFVQPYLRANVGVAF